MDYDFSGYATRANVRCADGRIILKDAFKDQDGAKIPIVWQHQRNDPDNVLGHGILENREDGVYVYGVLNNSPKARRTKALLEHGDIEALSIFANNLVEARKQVSHGVIREVSIVIAGANPGARIDNVTIQHGTDIILDDSAAVIQCEDVSEFELNHVDDEEDDTDTSKNNGPTAKEVFNTLNSDQKQLFYAAVAHALGENDSDDEGEEEDDKSTQHSAEDENDKGGNPDMKWNAFEGEGADTGKTKTLSHAAGVEIIKAAKKNGGSLREAFNDYFIEHADEYGLNKEDVIEHGIENLEVLFPEAKAITQTPDMIMRQQEWVPKVWGATRKSPFSRIKSITADITKDDARAKGYIKGNKKIEEKFAMLKRTTTPQTVYKHQRLDRDDVLDITDFNVIVWMKAEMRTMLMEELARAVLVGDGRGLSDEDHISHEHIRPVYLDDELYSIHKLVDIKADDDTKTEKADAILDAVYEAREEYRGSGSPTFFCPSSIVTIMLLARDNIGRRLYNTQAELASALRCKEIVEVPVMDNLTRETGSSDDDLPAGYKKSTKYDLLGIMVNLVDYTNGADRGGEVSLFDDFDLEFNKYTYLIETRVSGALYRPKSAIVLEKEHLGE